MKLLKKLLLINWHYFTHELLEFGQLNFMTGVNASGKSTVIDALQLVLFGDTAGRYFNKSASGKSARTLSSYLCGETGDNAEGGFTYLRNGRFTSYTVAEFHDDVKKRDFVIGGVYDVHSPTDIVIRFFRYYGSIPANHYIEDRVPMDTLRIREYFRSESVKDARIFESGKSYREEVYSMLGALRPKFKDLLKKAVAFNPDNNIQRFITEFVCDAEQRVDIEPMQANIRSYKNLERTAAELEQRKTALQNIADTYADYRRNCESKQLYSYLITRAKTQQEEETLDSLRNKEKATLEKILNIEENLRQEEYSYKTLLDQLHELDLQLLQNQTEIRLREIEKEINVLTVRLSRAHNEFDKTLALIRSIRTGFYRTKNDMSDRIASIHIDIPDGFISVQLDSLQTESEKLSSIFERMDRISPEKVIDCAEEDFRQIIELVDSIKEIAAVLYDKIRSAIQELDEDLRRLNDEQKSLEEGRYRYPKNALELKQAIISQIRAKTGKTEQVVLVAEAAEIKNDRWRNVIEGYLNTQRFYVIVPPQYIQLAISVFDRIKRDKAIYDTGVVDIEKIMKKDPRAERDSLAQELTTDNKYVRAYLDFVLGRVMKCDRTDRLRNYAVSVTDEGLLYKSYVIRAMDPKLWQRPAIGQNAIRRRLDEIRGEIKRKKDHLIVYSSLKECAASEKSLTCFSKSDAERFVETAEDLIKSRADEHRIAELEQERDSLDTGDVIRLRALIEEKEQDKDDTYRQIGVYRQTLGEEKGKLSSLQDEKIPQSESRLLELRSALSADYDENWVEDVGGPRYLSELSKRGSAALIAEAFPREQSKALNAIDKFRELLVSQRTQYNLRFKTGFDVNALDNGEFDAELRSISENELPDYLSRIEDTKKKAMEEFQEDFLSKLSDNINSVKRQIAELNRAISAASFGEDVYSFKVEPKKEYERFYRMITDEMLMCGYALMANQFNEKYKVEINELFSVMTGDGNASLDQSDYEKSVQLFTDYRTYLNFDIEVTNKDGEVQRLSRTIDKKSGGETQTPFYIAVLASFAQLYRIGRDQKANTARLIIFDEAFSKMDGERIEKSIMLLRQIGFQAILSTPTEKAGDIAPLVDRTLVVLRKGRHSQVTFFEKERIGELIDA